MYRLNLDRFLSFHYITYFVKTQGIFAENGRISLAELGNGNGK